MQGRAELLALLHEVSHGPWGLPGQLGTLAGFYVTHSPIYLPCVWCWARVCGLEYISN